MTDIAQTRRQSDGQVSVGTTASVGLGLAGGGNIVLYIAHCIAAEDFVAPSTETCLVIAAMLAPFSHLIARGILRRLTHWADGAAVS